MLNSTAIFAVTELGDLKQSIATISTDVPSILSAVTRIDEELQNFSHEIALVSSSALGISENMRVIKSHFQKSEEQHDILPLMKERMDALPASLASSIMLLLESRGPERYRLQLDGAGPSEIAKITEKIDALGQDIKLLQLQCVGKPSFLAEQLDNTSGAASVILNKPPKYVPPKTGPLHLLRKCNCRARTGSPRIRRISESFQILTKSTMTHQKGCPLFGSSEQARTHTLGVRTIFAAGFLAKALEISLGLTNGAGGCSLATSIRLRALLRNDSPAFQLFDTTALSVKIVVTEIDDENFSTYIMEALQKLQVWFSEGKASPNDINFEGRTVLQSASVWTDFFRFLPTNSRSQSARKTLLLSLAQMGVPLNHKDFHDEDALGNIISSERFANENIFAPEWKVWSSLVKLAPLPSLPSWVTPIMAFKIARDLEEYPDLYDCGILSAAILSKDHDAVEKTLRKRPHSINERNRLGQTPLHLAADWTWGTDRLLAAGAPVDIGDLKGSYPLEYASMVGCWTVFENLLESESPLLMDHDGNRLALRGRMRISLPSKTFDHVCTALANRRKRLKELAKEVLNYTVHSELISPNPILLDSKAQELFETILHRGWEIPSALQVPSDGSTVYHTYRLKPAEMSKLYDAGFREVDSEDSSGITPFIIDAKFYQHIADFSVCEWLISKGADPLHKIGQFGAVHIHYLGSKVAHAAINRLRILHRKNQIWCITEFTDLEPGLRLIMRHSGLTIHDQCRCGCSADGCSALHLVLIYTIIEIHSSLPSDGNPRCCADCKFQLSTLPQLEGILKNCVKEYNRSLYRFVTWALEFVHGNRGIPSSSYLEVIRLFLFLELELTHTCLILQYHSLSKELMPEDEIREIQEEEKETLLELETLCKEASARISLFEGSFYEFLEEFFSEVRQRPHGILSKEDIRKIEEVGVVLEQAPEY